jgi:hypothetical protein
MSRALTRKRLPIVLAADRRMSVLASLSRFMILALPTS